MTSRMGSRIISAVDELPIDTFSPLLNDRFAVAAGGTRVELQLVEVTSRAHHGRAGHRPPFVLLFAGPPAPVLPQAIYPLEHAAAGRFDLFIVPVGPAASGAMQYEVIFN